MAVQATDDANGGGCTATQPCAVSDDAVSRTQCRENFPCLQKPDCCRCVVEACISSRYLFVKPQGTTVCPYLVEFGFTSHVCGCPVRNELYRKYSV